MCVQQQSNCQLSDNHPYLKTVSDLVLAVGARFHNILHRSDLLYYLSKDGKKFAQNCKIVHDYTESVIRERKKALGIDGTGLKGSVLERASEQRKYLDFLDIFLTAQDEDGRGLTDLEIRDEAD